MNSFSSALDFHYLCPKFKELNMKKIYALLFSMLAVTGVAAQKPVMAAGSTTCYTGSLDVTMMGAPIATGQSATVSMIEDAEGNFTFSLPDFVISVGGSQLECGDIVVEGVTRTDLEGDGVYDIVGSVNDLSLAEGEIHAKVDISGTENAETGAIDLDIEVGWYTGYPDDMESTMPIAVKFTGVRATIYTGSLDVTMMDFPIATGQSATVSMIEDAEGNFTFSLPDFVISVGGSLLECGDIVVEGVTRTDLEGDGVYDIVGSVNDLSLAEGEIHAKVDISGTENAETGAIDLDIEVGWYTGYPDDMESTMPIAVKFTGTRVGDDPAGVEALPVAGDVLINATTGGVTVSGFVGNVEVYTVDGRLAAIVASDGETMVALRSGLYIVRADKAVKKVIVK